MRQPSRRALLRTSAGLTATALAGCVGGESADFATRTTAESTPTATTAGETNRTTETTEESDHPDSERVAW